MKLDHYDLAILRELQRDGRISKRDLAGKIGLSVSPCWARTGICASDLCNSIITLCNRCLLTTKHALYCLVSAQGDAAMPPKSLR